MPRQKSQFPGAYREKDRHGKVRWRYRRGGVSAQLPGQYASPEFIVAYEAAVNGTDQQPGGTARRYSMAWLVTQYLGSDDYKGMAESTKKVARRRYDWIRDQVGGFDMRELRHRISMPSQRKRVAPLRPIAAKRIFRACSHLQWLRVG